MKGYGIIDTIIPNNNMADVEEATTTMTKGSIEVPHSKQQGSTTEDRVVAADDDVVYDNYYLLSHSEAGHVFRNRLVHREYIHNEDFIEL